MKPTPPKAAAVAAISSVAVVENEEDPVAATFLCLGTGIPEAPVAQGSRGGTTLVTAG